MGDSEPWVVTVTVTCPAAAAGRNRTTLQVVLALPRNKWPQFKLSRDEATNVKADSEADFAVLDHDCNLVLPVTRRLRSSRSSCRRVREITRANPRT
eukprot:342083-Rhodomonas_salina.1